MTVIEFIKEWWDRYQAQKKSDELYNKLHKYDGVKFRQKDAIKAARAAYKNKMKKDREKQQDLKK